MLKTKPAPPIDVIRDQFERLMEHVKTGCSGCEECRRFLAVSQILMRPFQEGKPCKTS